MNSKPILYRLEIDYPLPPPTPPPQKKKMGGGENILRLEYDTLINYAGITGKRKIESQFHHQTWHQLSISLMNSKRPLNMFTVTSDNLASAIEFSSFKPSALF